MDLFKEVLPAIDKGDTRWVENLSDAELKEVAPFVVMKFMSASNTKGMEDYHILAVNEIVNKRFWELNEHKELQMLLLAICGTGKRQYHYFPGASKTDGKLFKFFHKIHPLWKMDEIEMFIELSTKEELIQIGKDSGMQDKDLKLFKKDVNKYK